MVVSTRRVTSPKPMDTNSLHAMEIDASRSIDRRKNRSLSLASQLRAIVYGSKLNILVMLLPAAVCADILELSPTTIFTLSLLALAPLAERLGYATEQVSLYTNSTIGGLLNATFGNATEMIVSLSALVKGRPGGSDNPVFFRRLIQMSLLGSVLSNLLLVLGSAFLVGGIRFHRQRFKVSGSSIPMMLLVLSCGVIIFPVFLGLVDEEHTDATIGPNSSTVSPILVSHTLVYSRFASIWQLGLYGLFLFFQLRTHRDMYEDEEEHGDERGAEKFVGYNPIRRHNSRSSVGAHEIETSYAHAQTGLSDVDADHLLPVPMTAGMTVIDVAHQDEDAVSSNSRLPSPAHKLSISDELSRSSTGEEEDGEELPEIEFSTAVVVLLFVTLLVTLLSEFMVGAVEGAAKDWNVSSLFLGGIVIPIVGNAAEHASAVIFGYRNKMDIAVGVSVGSAVQIALFVLPCCVIIAWAIGCPLDLSLGTLETASFVIAVLVAYAAMHHAESTWLHGCVLITAYLTIGAAFWTHP